MLLLFLDTFGKGWKVCRFVDVRNLPVKTLSSRRSTSAKPTEGRPGPSGDDGGHLDGSLGAALVVEADEAKAFALVCSSVNEHLIMVGDNYDEYHDHADHGGDAIDEDLGADDISKWQEHLHQLGIAKLLRTFKRFQICKLRSRGSNVKTC